MLQRLRIPASPGWVVSPSAWVSLLWTRENLSGLSFAIAIVCVITEPTIISPLFFYYPIFIYIGLRLATRRQFSWSVEIALGALIAVSAVIAIPLSLLFDRNWAATAFHAALTLILFPLLFVSNVKQVFYAMIPACYYQAALMWWQWITTEMARAPGITINANAGSSFLLLGAIFLLHHPRLKWLSIPLLASIPLSGSRWVTLVGITVLLLIFISRYVPWKYILIGITIAFVALVSLQSSDLAMAYFTSRGDAPIIEQGQRDAAWRLTAASEIFTPLIIVPQGFINSQLHNVPIRMATETGLLSGIAWLGVSGLVLYRRPRLSYAWWMMLTVCLLSAMYYFTWIGPLGMFWWLLVSDLTKRSEPGPTPATSQFAPVA